MSKGVFFLAVAEGFWLGPPPKSAQTRTLPPSLSLCTCASEKPALSPSERPSQGPALSDGSVMPTFKALLTSQQSSHLPTPATPQRERGFWDKTDYRLHNAIPHQVQQLHWRHK